MRTRKTAPELQVGMYAFLPYWGKLRKAKVLDVSARISTRAGDRISVRYRPLGEGRSTTEFLCVMDADSGRTYEVYERPQAK